MQPSIAETARRDPERDRRLPSERSPRSSLIGVSELPISSKYRSRPNDPVTEAEREQLSDRLNEALTRGTLDQETYSSRLDQLFAAQRLGELVPVVESLPAQQVSNDPEIVQQGGGKPGELTESKDATRLSLLAIGGIAAIVILLVIVLLILL